LLLEVTEKGAESVGAVTPARHDGSVNGVDIPRQVVEVTAEGVVRAEPGRVYLAREVLFMDLGRCVVMVLMTNDHALFPVFGL